MSDHQEERHAGPEGVGVTTDLPTGWEARAREALAERSVPPELADSALAEVAEHCAESGERPSVTFGPPRKFAEAVVRERLPEDVQARHAAGAPAPHGSAVLAQLGLMALVLGGYLTVVRGWLVDVTAAGLIGSVFVVGAVWSLHAVAHARHAASRGGAVGYAAGVLGGIVLAAVTFTLGPDSVVAPVPPLGIVMLGLALLGWVLFRHRPQDHTGPTPGSGMPGEHGLGEQRLPNEAWLRRLPQLLEMRYDLPRDRAAELTEEALRHLAEAGTEAEEEFGPVTAYAGRLANGETSQERWWQRKDLPIAAGTAMAGTYLLDQLHDNGSAWWIGLAAVATALGVYSFASSQRERRAGKRS